MSFFRGYVRLHFHTFWGVWCLSLLQLQEYRYNNARKCEISNEILHTCGARKGRSLQKSEGVC